MSARAQYSGAVGTVVDGYFRDLQEHRNLSYPVGAAVDRMRTRWLRLVHRYSPETCQAQLTMRLLDPVK